MSEVDVLPELKEIVGAVLFAAKQPVTLDQLVELFPQTAGQLGGIAKDYASASRADLDAALAAFRTDLEQAKLGLCVVEVAGGFRLENRPACGPWLRQYLEKGRPNRLSRLAIIAYRQPVMRSEIESVRGVAVDQILRNLLDLQLIRIAGRSDLPGRPWLFGTTQKFLEQFGLRSLDDLPGVEELRRIEETRAAPPAPGLGGGAAGAPAPVVGFAGGPVAAADDTAEASSGSAASEAEAVAPPAGEDDFVIDDTADEFDDDEDDETDFDDEEDQDFHELDGGSSGEETGGEPADENPETRDGPEERP